MSTLDDISWPEYTEQDWAASDPNGNPDIMNEGYDILWEVFCVEHDKDGDHWTTGSTYAKIEEDSYAGDGNPTQTITLTDGTLDVKWLKLMGSDLGDVYVSTESFASDKAADAEFGGAFSATVIDSVGTGQFIVNTDANTSAETYYYVVVGE